MKKVNFRDWTMDAIDEAFGTSETDSCPFLDKLLEFKYEISDYEKMYLLQLQLSYKRHSGEDWNECELANKFISPLIIFTEFTSIGNKKYGYFLERDLATSVGDYELVGKVDGMIATGFRHPKKPYFCLNEYKKESDPNGDPRGQLLIAMITVQALNQDNNPIYGVYVVGKLWRFIVLTGKSYTFSDAFVATKKDIFEIYKILKGLRHEIEALLN
jgi:hypothetical protein